MTHLLLGRRIVLPLAASLALICLVTAQTTLQVGYSVYTADAGSKLPVGTALFRVSDVNGAVVSEAGVGAADPIRRGRIFVDEVGTRMGMALVNANPSRASITFTLFNSAGAEIARRNSTLGANQHLAIYVSELFSSQAAGLRGSLNFESDQPLAAITLRENRNRAGEPLYTTLPVTDLSATPSTNTVVFPHIAAGGGFITELLLMNPTSSAMTGEVAFYDSSGRPLTLQNGDQNVSRLPYNIAGNGTFRAALTAPALVSGWAAAVPAAGSPAPSGSVIFQWRVNNQVVSEAGVAATNAMYAARIFVDHLQTQTGVAIVNPSDLTANMTLTLMDRNGNIEDSQTRTLPGGNHLAAYVNELFPSVINGFTGLLEIGSDIAVAPITLKLTTNARGDLVLTTLPVADLSRVSSSTRLIFPQIAIGGAFSTRLIFINTDTASAASGRLSFSQSDGNNLVVPMGAETGSQFLARLGAGGGRQFYPGNGARVSNITAIDPTDGRPTTEITINEGNTVRPRFRITDSSGGWRDDFDVTVQSLDTSIAGVDNTGAIHGTRAGFSTLTVIAAGVVTTTTATVVSVNSGVTGLGVRGVVQDLSKRLYLAASTEHAILLAEDLKQAPATYAGIRTNPGLKDGARLESQFRNPSFLAFDQAQGTLYVSDGANNVIRRVTPGGVVTIAGAGLAGSQDGPLLQARFSNPQGITLDGRGNLWVADSGNQTIRRINLQTGIVETIAGAAGSAGFVDGVGSEARFNGLAGLTAETESPIQQLERERRGAPPPPASVLAVDSGNNVIRRIIENGVVETIGAGNVSLIREATEKPVAASATVPIDPVFFNTPTAVAADPFGNLFVTETSTGQVKSLLNTGKVVTAAQRQTFAAPSGLAISDGGRLVVADSNSALQELTYGPPVVTSIATSGTTTSSTVTIRGQNFAPDSIVTPCNFTITNSTLENSRTITFRTPALRSGRISVLVRHRGGVARGSLVIEGPNLNQLPAGYVTTIAGGDTCAGDGSLATEATIAGPGAMALDQAGNLFVTERGFNRVRRIDAATKVITTFAGNGEGIFSGDGGPATSAGISLPLGVALDIGGNLLITDTNFRIRRVDAITKLISTMAGTGTMGPAGDNGPATLAKLETPGSLAIGPNGHLYFTDGAARIRKIDGRTSIITTYVGTGTQGFSGDNGPASGALIDFVIPGTAKGIAIDQQGNLLFGDRGNFVVRRVDATTELITTVAGTGRNSGPVGDGGVATSAVLRTPVAVTFDTLGNFLIGEAPLTGSRIRKVNAVSGIIQTVAGTGALGYSGDGGPAISATLKSVYGLVTDAAGNFFFSDSTDHRIRRVDGKSGIISTIAGTGQAIRASDGEPAKLAPLAAPAGIAVDTRNGLLIMDSQDSKVRRVDPQTGIISTIAGTGAIGFSGDNGPALEAAFNAPNGVIADSAGNIFISEETRIRMISGTTGIVTTIAGTGAFAFSGDGGPAVQASLNLRTIGTYAERQMALDSAGNLFIPDGGNHRIRKIDRRSGIITTVAGNGQAAFSGDGGSATSASLNQPMGVALDAAGNLFIADTSNNRIRKVNAQSGVITTIAGTGARGFGGDGGPATAAILDTPMAVAFDAAQNLYSSDRNFGSRIRRISATTGIITTVVGSTGRGYGGDGGPAKSAIFAGLAGIAFDASGNLFMVDVYNHRIRAVRGPIP